jgi:hypothetical protein
MEGGEEVHSSPAPTSVSYEMESQEWEHNIEDMVGGDHDGQSGGDPPPACPCHNTPIGSCPGFIRTFVSLVTAVTHHPSGGTNMDGARIQLPLRTIHPEPWEQLLCGYYDKEVLVNSLRYGWDLSFLPGPAPKDSTFNLPSAMEYPDSVDAYINQELMFGTLVGPLPSVLPFATFCSPLGSVPKPGSDEAKRRCITDCSQRGEGINMWIPCDHHRGAPFKVHLPGSLDIIAGITRLRQRHPGRRLQMFKFDFARYYRQFLVDPSQSPFLCIMWRGKKYADRSWSFGNRGACMGSQRFSAAVAWLFRTQLAPSPGAVNSGANCKCPSTCECGDNECFPYIDDNIIICYEDVAWFLYHSFIDLVQQLGIQLSTTPGHITTPDYTCVALGVEYDLDANIISLPDIKLEALDILLANWQVKETATRKELDSLAGKLLYCCQVVPPGRIFLARVLETKSLVSDNHHVTLDQEFKLDINWWHKMVRNWNGKSFLEFHHTGDVSLDASSRGWYNNRPGIGAYNFSNNEFFSTGVPEELWEWDICDLELVAHVLACNTWASLWHGKKVSMLTDNEACRFFMQHGRSKCPKRLKMGRYITGLQFREDFRVFTARITTDQNTLSDCLSREGEPGKLESFFKECHQNNVSPTRRQIDPGVFKLVLDQGIV